MKAYKFIPGLEPILVDLDEVIQSGDYDHYALGDMLEISFGLFFKHHNEYNLMTDNLVIYMGENIPDLHHTIYRNNISVLYDDNADMTPQKLQRVIDFIKKREEEYPRL